ncbi:bifunctional riboflavin kinase/FAD synthetase [Cryobacterium sp. TMT1-21]|uniref:Riboflavin biosynthesis protein n=1 Tax=Cryobacterium shii TaxID=1259235 RepID=A0AAQ2C7M3_9MICO|nr:MULTISPECIES: bifunctional riboflavin kinase/FAD synthetase [Cryobacterium]TFC50159.1 bifunctional riboflavin kinase/FAD synthetase [Cryobacterium shii]TFC82511.1 bifunctional riboflavin kinase/FAD synthetase [Cryobacterium sp. TmT2-59]TFD15281.1 bifunctional riboflavin kinase/FAD synthetase [Cryobacterium sp. TMT4-10]TFD18110.1 bifunctional riboflavin kinase/FAD synthetase [Cryobacterium sp. TMT1-21]TFD25021.1 bifunctional riboflavin kinase/FAD synthetase [Cryobacterium sp. TMT2-23]
MKIMRGVAAIPEDWPASAVSIGKFDGVHAGHRAVVAELKSAAEQAGLASVVVTFDRHPLSLLKPDACPQALISTEQKLALLAETGVDASLVLEFNQALAGLPPEDFIERILVRGLHARSVLVGRDFRFGAGGVGDVALLQQLGDRFGFAVRLIEDVMPDRSRRVSSTWIRELLAQGDVRAASVLLGHVPTVRGEVVHGAKRGRELGFPTANLSPHSEGLIPADGVYAGWLTDAGIRYPAAISVGNNPTFDGVPQKQVEAHVLDRDIDLYGHVVEVSFVDRIRGMVAFTGVDPLIVQMRDDVERARGILV